MDDGYIRGALGFALILPPFALLLVLYHAILIQIIKHVRLNIAFTYLAASVVVSAVSSAAFLASGAPLSWDRIGPFIEVMVVVWILLVLGSIAQYLICFRKRDNVSSM